MADNDKTTTAGTDNLDGGPSTDNSSVQTTGTTPSPGASDSQGDKFAGKDRNAVMDMYRNMERKMHQDAELLGEYRSAFETLRPFLKAEGDNLVPNVEMMQLYLQREGLLPAQGNGANPGNNNQKQDDFLEKFDKDPKSALHEQIQSVIKDVLAEQLEPLKKDFAATQQQGWIKEVSVKNPDFDKYRIKIGELIAQKNLKINSAEDLEAAYRFAKLEDGGYVPKEEHEKHVSALERSLSVVNPSALRVRINPTEATNAQLFGLDRAETEESKATKALFGKAVLNEE